MLLLTLLVLPLSVAAQEAPTQTVTDKEALKKLITTLESDTARTEFLGNLKLLLEEQNKEQADAQVIAPITKTLGIESFTERMVTSYQDFLMRNGLSGSVVGKVALSIGATLVMFLLALTARRGVTKFLMAADKFFVKLDMPPIRLRLYGRALRTLASIAVACLLLYSFFVIWGTTRFNPFESSWFKGSLRIIFNLGFVMVMAAVFWETVNTILQIVFRKVSGNNPARAQTIMPIVRNVLFIVFAVLFLLVLLSELGINIMPLLAGAGIVGVAIGFGAQTMVKDFLTGFTILMEDVVRVGDVARMAGRSGVIEKITLRKIQLRDVTGTVFTIPFSEINIIENQTKDFSFYPIDVVISYNEDIERVEKILRDVDASMRTDPTFAPDMMEPIEIMGVDRFSESGVVIKVRLKTQPLKQWNIGREFNRRMKKAFDVNNVEMPFPNYTLTLRGDKAVLDGK
ncbi:MAG: mechanosensitive ion channel family protein [Alphaproteobacteria bacterium]|nr:mechanosensitive ion channel family protein [Alphaproteobacteria bacterium]